MSSVLAIDPGPIESAFCLIDSGSRKPVRFAKVSNYSLLVRLRIDLLQQDVAAVEMIASYGMSVGAEVFETCVWIGRFVEAMSQKDEAVQLVKRQPVKLHHCKSAKAKDSNVRQALIDRFGQGASNGGKGTKAEPGWFYGFAADVWQSYALAVFVADQQAGVTP
jgi:hypothetical protein